MKNEFKIRKNCNEESLKVIKHIYENLNLNLNIFNHENYEWIEKSGSGYEPELCKLLNWNFVNKRHWDCEFNDIKIELKKSLSNGIPVDEIRYAEEVLEINSDCMENIITIFIEVYSKTCKKNGIRRLMIVKNEEIIKMLKMTNEYCLILHRRKQEIGSGLAYTHRLKYLDLIQVADAYIEFE
jgi:hypothetical protein